MVLDRSKAKCTAKIVDNSRDNYLPDYFVRKRNKKKEEVINRHLLSSILSSLWLFLRYFILSLHFYRMADSDASDDSAIIVRVDDARLVKYMKYIVICKTCSHVLYSANQWIQREENWTSYPIDALTVKLDSVTIEWKCRNCDSLLSENVPTIVVSTNLVRDQCVLSHDNTAHKFAVIEVLS